MILMDFPQKKGTMKLLQRVVKDASKRVRKQDAVMTMGLDDEEKCLVNYEADSSTGELINKSQEAEIKKFDNR